MKKKSTQRRTPKPLPKEEVANTCAQAMEPIRVPQPPSDSNAVKITKEIEQLNETLGYRIGELEHHRKVVHNLELDIANTKLNLQAMKEQLREKLTAPTPLV